MAALSRREADLDDYLPHNTETFNPSFFKQLLLKGGDKKMKSLSTGPALHSDGQPAQEYLPTQKGRQKQRATDVGE